MADGMELKDAQAMYDGAVDARINLCVFEGNAKIPGEVASLARMLWFHVPEIARRSGVEIDASREGYPTGVSSTDQKLVESITQDMAGGRDMVAWLAAVASPETKAMFAKGEENSMNGFLDRFAAERGFKRDDLLSRERDERMGVAPDRSATVEASTQVRGPSPAVAAHLSAGASR